jgi:ASC-1-like (ASCH) protein
VRLNDEKRRKLRVGDTVTFSSMTGSDETIRVEVLALRPYQTFAEMYEAIPFPDFGCAGWTMEQMPEGTYKIYTPEQEKRWERWPLPSNIWSRGERRVIGRKGRAHWPRNRRLAAFAGFWA